MSIWFNDQRGVSLTCQSFSWQPRQAIDNNLNDCTNAARFIYGKSASVTRGVSAVLQGVAQLLLVSHICVETEQWQQPTGSP